MAKRAKTALAGTHIRLREPLRRRLESAAKARGVSMSAEITERLEASFRNELQIDLLTRMSNYMGNRLSQLEPGKDVVSDALNAIADKVVPISITMGDKK
jgi:hypothetical protein